MYDICIPTDVHMATFPIQAQSHDAGVLQCKFNHVRTCMYLHVPKSQ